MLWWLPKSRILNCSVVFSLSTFFILELLKDAPEIFKGADILHSFFTNLSMGVIASYVFYIIVVYWPAKNIQRHQASKLRFRIRLYFERYIRALNLSYQSLEDFYQDLEGNNFELNNSGKFKTTHILFSNVINFEKELEKYLNLFTSSYISENDEIINKIEIILNHDEIMDRYRLNVILRRDTIEDFESNFITECLFGRTATKTGISEISCIFKLHIKNCIELADILKKNYN